MRQKKMIWLILGLLCLVGLEVAVIGDAVRSLMISAEGGTFSPLGERGGGSPPKVGQRLCLA